MRNSSFNRSFGKQVCKVSRKKIVFLCLLVWGFSFHSRIFAHMDKSLFTVKRFQNLTYAQHSCQLTVRVLQHVTPVDRRLALELSLPVLLTQVSRSWDSKTHLPLAGQNSYRLRHRRGIFVRNSLIGSHVLMNRQSSCLVEKSLHNRK